MTKSFYHCEADILEGLAPFVFAELDKAFGQRIRYLPSARPDAITFEYAGALPELLDLRSVVAISLVQPFAVPRPKALLGHEHMRRLLEMISTARELWNKGRFATLKISAAGEDSPVMQRLKDELAQQTNLRPDQEEGDLLLRLRRAGDGWEALVRLSPRPLATRPWRVCNMPGALNASLAHAMVVFSQPHPDQRVLNMACGSGTLMIERLALAPARKIVGCDLQPEALACARANLEAATGYEFPHDQPARLEPWDAGETPLRAASIDVILADLPFGQLIGSHAENELLYPRILAEAARLLVPGGRLVLITHEVRLLERVASDLPAFRLSSELRVRSGGMAPRVYLFERKSEGGKMLNAAADNEFNQSDTT
ncbi:MAG: methyltransferase domain-containing protein [Roseiflexaceae bacterium]|nr:methyltransferase domain-containing protein [Roseiflexaceae bacterium]